MPVYTSALLTPYTLDCFIVSRVLLYISLLEPICQAKLKKVWVVVFFFLLMCFYFWVKKEKKACLHAILLFKTHFTGEKRIVF